MLSKEEKVVEKGKLSKEDKVVERRKGCRKEGKVFESRECCQKKRGCGKKDVERRVDCRK